MAEVRLVETSLRDGNQCLWSALGVDTAKTLSIAPVMDRVGFEAIDFTTSTHMGVAVRYKREDPWERIRLMAAATPNTPLQFMGTGFRFISWETASAEFMSLAYGTLATRGCVELDAANAREFMMGRDVWPEQDAGSGEVIVRYQGHPLGMGKWVGSRIKNALPRELVRDNNLFNE